MVLTLMSNYEPCGHSNVLSNRGTPIMLQQLRLTVFFRGSGCRIYIEVFGDGLV